MKVGVLTFFRSTNFGTMLQAHATILAIEAAGAEAELIDYRPEYIESTFRKKRKTKTPKQLISVLYNRMVFGNAYAKKVDRFREYYENLKVGKYVCTTAESVRKIVSDYDVILSGSDQLWNKNITGSDMTYFLPFAHPKKISLSSSFGTVSISSERSEEISSNLRAFEYITVREKTAQRIVLEILNSNDEALAKVTLDPTLIISKEEWLSYAKPVSNLPKQDYILTYYMIETPLLRKITEELRERTGLPIVNIKPSKRQMITHEGINYPDLGPGEFLTCYAHARYVVTNSFHGTAFAINFGIPVYVSPLPVSMAGEVNSRLIDLLHSFDISNRWIDSEEKVSQIDIGEMMPTKNSLNNRRIETKNCLQSMIFDEERA